MQHYSENSAEKPPFLQDFDYYFDKTDLAPIPQKELEDISDSEMQTRTTQEDLEKKQKEALNKSLDFLVVSYQYRLLNYTHSHLINTNRSLFVNRNNWMRQMQRLSRSRKVLRITPSRQSSTLLRSTRQLVKTKTSRLWKLPLCKT